MEEIRISREEDLPQLRALWQMAFGDGEEFLELFFRGYDCPERTLVLCEGGRVMTMLFLLPTTLVDGKGGFMPMPYVYALATHREARGKGCARRLLGFAGRWARQMGAEGISTVPAEPSLHKFFASAGFREGFSSRKIALCWEELSQGEIEGSIVPVDARSYNLLREELLREIPHVAYPDQLVELQRGMSRQTGADLYRIYAAGQQGCAAAERGEEDTVVAKELLCPGGMMASAQRLLARALPAARYQFRTPAAQGDAGWHFGMVRGFCDKGQRIFDGGGAYMGLAFD